MDSGDNACQPAALAERHIDPCPLSRRKLQGIRYLVGEQAVQRYRENYVGVHRHCLAKIIVIFAEILRCVYSFGWLSKNLTKKLAVNFLMSGLTL